MLFKKLLTGFTVRAEHICLKYNMQVFYKQRNNKFKRMNDFVCQLETFVK